MSPGTPSSLVCSVKTSLIKSVWPGATASENFFFNVSWVLKNFCSGLFLHLNMKLSVS